MGHFLHIWNWLQEPFSKWSIVRGKVLELWLNGYRSKTKHNALTSQYTYTRFNHLLGKKRLLDFKNHETDFSKATFSVYLDHFSTGK